MTIKDELPHDPEAAHALVRQKLNEHTDAIREIRDENVKQNVKLDRIERQVQDVKRNTAGVVTVVHFVDKLCHMVKLTGKIIVWFAGVAGAAVALYQLYIMYWNQ